DSRWHGLANYAERPAAKTDDSAGCGIGGGRIQRPEAVGHIVGFRPDLDALALGKPEDPRKREIETPGLQAAHAVAADVPERASRGNGKRAPIQEVGSRSSRPIPIGAGQDPLRPPGGGARR